MKKNNGIKKTNSGIKKTTSGIKNANSSMKSTLGKFDSDNLPKGMDKETFEKLIKEKKKKMNMMIAGGTIVLVIVIIVLVMGIKSCAGSGISKAEKKVSRKTKSIAKNILNKDISPYKKSWEKFNLIYNKKQPNTIAEIDGYINQLHILLESHKGKVKYNDEYKLKIEKFIARLENLREMY